MCVDYCLSDGDGSATMWTTSLDTDVDGDGRLDAVGLDVDADGSVDDALADLDGDGVADHAVLDDQSYFTDDGSGTWAVSVDRGGQVYAGAVLLTGGIGGPYSGVYRSSDGLFSYAFTGDLDQTRLLRLVSSARLP